MRTPKAASAKSTVKRGPEPTTSPEAVLQAIAPGERRLALHALVEAGNAAFTFQKAIEQGDGSDAEKPELQRLFDEAKAKALEAEAAVIALWDQGIAGADDLVADLRAEIARLEQEIEGLKNASPTETGTGAGDPAGPIVADQSTYTAVVTAKQACRWRIGRQFTKEPVTVSVGAGGITEAEFDALLDDPQLLVTFP